MLVDPRTMNSLSNHANIEPEADQPSPKLDTSFVKRKIGGDVKAGFETGHGNNKNKPKNVRLTTMMILLRHDEVAFVYNNGITMVLLIYLLLLLLVLPITISIRRSSNRVVFCSQLKAEVVRLMEPHVLEGCYVMMKYQIISTTFNVYTRMNVYDNIHLPHKLSLSRLLLLLLMVTDTGYQLPNRVIKYQK